MDTSSFPSTKQSIGVTSTEGVCASTVQPLLFHLCGFETSLGAGGKQQTTGPDPMGAVPERASVSWDLKMSCAAEETLRPELRML